MIADLMNLPDKAQVLELHGTLKSVWPRENKDGNYGPYTTQNIVVTDATGQVTVGLRSQGEIPQSAKGSDIKIACTSGERGLSGLAVRRYTDKAGQPKMLLQATGQASVTITAGSSAPAPAAAAQAPDRNPVAVDPKTGLAKATNLMLACIEAGDNVYRHYMHSHGEPMEASQYQAVVSTLFIWADKQGMVLSMPTVLPKECAPTSHDAADDDVPME